MKKVCTKIFAALLVVWYLVGIIGFDMHTCNGSGRSFVVAFFEGMACEDIHPEHVCDEAWSMKHAAATIITIQNVLSLQNPAVQMITFRWDLPVPYLRMTIVIMTNVLAGIVCVRSFIRPGQIFSLGIFL